MYNNLKYGLEIMKAELNSFVHDENGDTNFISIIVILAIALAVAALFIAFKDKIIEWVNEELPDIFSNGGGHNGTDLG